MSQRGLEIERSGGVGDFVLSGEQINGRTFEGWCWLAFCVFFCFGGDSRRNHVYGD